ncbi:alpha/beta fold hydrolase [Variovorax terrae]|uniref:Alpha/beta fold hydrolase n=1 Tax=Variovorax terrae TaxID=2923278 RepID=A0A9X1VZE3_9BURK|nr:alpha/beta fold hydrolase [Variovorax terrae]MCJ0765699.1 alpha/beta fold hydrolase [Variovorax terrae]
MKLEAATPHANFVLVHGAWHGGWCWAPVVQRLEALGHRCYAPTLSGMAHRAAELTPEVDADTHARDIIALVEALDLRRVVLALHSYAGVLGPALLARLRERLAHIAWIEAVIPPPGAAMLELTLPEAAQRYRASAADVGEGWWMPPPDVAQFRLADAALAAQVGARLTRQPLRSFSEPLRLPQQEVFGFPGSVLVANDRTPAPYARYVAQARAAGWPVREVPGGHLLMLSNPDAVTGFLADIAAGPDGSSGRNPR